MNMDERIEAAARALWEKSWEGGQPQWTWEGLAEPFKFIWVEDARKALAAAFPELQGDKPAGWIAPWEPTLEMELAAERFDHGELPSRGYQHFVAMRDAYLGKGGGG